MSEPTELVIIGAGPGGYSAAFHAADLGMSVTLIDPEPNPGGVCLYRGCIPSKALLHVGAFLHEVEQAPAWGLTLGKPHLNLDQLRSWKDSVIQKTTDGVGALVRLRKIDYIRGTARFKDAHRVIVTPVGETARELEFHQALVATGSLPSAIPRLPDSRRLMTSTEALEIESIPERLLVVGGGYIGVELGQVYAALGSRVTVVEMLPDILPAADRDLVRVLLKRLKSQFEGLLTGTRVQQMTEADDGMRVAFDGEQASEKTFDKVLIAVGRKPFSKGVGLEHTRVTVTEKGFIQTDAQRRTAEASIFAIGDVAGEPMLAHKAAHEARVAVEAMAGRKTIFEPRAIPAVVFTDPEIAWCGLTQQEAERTGKKVKVTTFPWSASGRAETLSRKDGLTKLILEPDTGRILGVGMAGHNAGELLAEGVLAMELGAGADDVALTIHTHPTLSETLMEAAQAYSGTSAHFMGK